MRFRALDGWRGIAAMLGVLYHWPLYGHLYSNFVIRNAYLFVDFFFVLSGFVLTFAYAERISSRQTTLTFLFRRLGRLWPLHATMLGLFVLFEVAKAAVATHGLHFRHEAFTGPHSIASLIANLALLHALGIYDHLTWNSPSWSLSAQFWGYAVFAVVILIWPRRSVLISVVGAIVIWLMLGICSTHVPLNDITYDYGLPRYLLGLCIGHLTYRLYASRLYASPPDSGRKPWPWSRRWVSEFVVLFGLMSFVYFAGTGYLTLVSAAVFAVVIYTFAREHGPISVLLKSGPIQKLGRWSYSIYLTHLLVITIALEACHLFERVAGRNLLVEAPDTPTGALTMAVPFSAYAMDAATFVYVAGVIAFGALMHRLVEVPCRGWVDRRADTRLRSSSADAKEWRGVAAFAGRRP